MFVWRRLDFIDNIAVYMRALAGTAQTDLTSALAVPAASESSRFPLKETQTSSHALARGVMAFLKSTGLIGTGTENCSSNQKKIYHFGAVRACVTWFVFTLLVCMVAVSSTATLQPPRRRDDGTERAPLPTLRWDPHCQDSSCFPLCLCFFWENTPE